jgi:alkylation response protein AidB-like acyl-CoA dehydrogenase
VRPQIRYLGLRCVIAIYYDAYRYKSSSLESMGSRVAPPWPQKREADRRGQSLALPEGYLNLRSTTNSLGLVSLRHSARQFLNDALRLGSFEPRCDSWLSGHDPAFTTRLASKGWIGMTWPREYGGGGRTYLERQVVLEELLAAGAPVAAHWMADRQTGPVLLRYGTATQCLRFLPEIAAGRCFFAIGLSEPDAGSDLAAVRTRAQRSAGGWTLNGTKVWTSHAHRSQFMMTLVRTDGAALGRHAGMSQMIVDLAAPGVTIRPIPTFNGSEHFNEVTLQDAFVSDDMLVGQEGDGWQQVTSELAYERSGPERFLSTFPLLKEMVSEIGTSPNPQQATIVGTLVARLWSIRAMSMSLAERLQTGELPVSDAALVKDLGTRFERSVVEEARIAVDPSRASKDFRLMYQQSIEAAPGFTLRGGTTEILQSVIAKTVEPGRPAGADDISRMLNETADRVFGTPRSDYVAEAQMAGFTGGEIDLEAASIIIASASYHGSGDGVAEAVMPSMESSAHRLALLRAIELRGAIERTRDMTIEYARDRRQFDRALGDFQAVRGHIANLVGEAAIASAAVDQAISAPTPERIAAAKIVTSQGAGRVAAAAHQIHGAIGLTEEHRLHHWTTRLWKLRDQGGRETEWASWLGGQICAAGADRLWGITSLSDQRLPEDEHV